MSAGLFAAIAKLDEFESRHFFMDGGRVIHLAFPAAENVAFLKEFIPEISLPPNYSGY